MAAPDDPVTQSVGGQDLEPRVDRGMEIARPRQQPHDLDQADEAVGSGSNSSSPV